MRIKNIYIPVTIVIVILLIVLSLWKRNLTCSEYLENCLSSPPCWQTVCVGKTHLEELTAQWGTPVLQKTHDENQPWDVWVFDHPPLEIWTDQKEIVHVIFLNKGVHTNLQIGRLGKNYVERLGRPDKVTWGSYPGLRYWIWSREGIAVEIESGLNWQEELATQVIYFDPLPISEFSQKLPSWPFNTYEGPSLHNTGDPDEIDLRIMQDVMDSGPENPYDLSQLPVYIPCSISDSQKILCQWK